MAALSLGNCASEEEAIFQVEAAGSGGGLVPDGLQEAAFVASRV